MKSVFEPTNLAEAHMILHLLEQAGLHGRVDGEHLLGGVGELPAIGLLKVTVNDEDYEQACSIIKEWNGLQTPTEPQEQVKSSGKVGSFLLGALIAGIVSWALTIPETSDGIDNNEDGVWDEKYIYQGNTLSRVEFDRNFNGEVDLIYSYDRRNILIRAVADDNFDGKFETTIEYRNGNRKLLESDTDDDGKIDYRIIYRRGMTNKIEFIDPVKNSVVKRKLFGDFKLKSTEFDSNGDGTFDTIFEYDQYEEIKR
jgi:hypothetical protein